MTLNENDVIILYTDGLTEGRNMAGEMYTLEKLIESVERFAGEYGPDGIVNHVALDYSRFVENHVQDDDVTLIAVQYVGANHKESKGLVSTSWTASEKIEKPKVVKKKKTNKDSKEVVKESAEKDKPVVDADKEDVKEEKVVSEEKEISS